MKIGILTFFRPINYGAYLQAYALSHRLNEEKDINAEIIDFHMPIEDKFYKTKKKITKNIPKTIFNKRRFNLFQNQIGFQLLSDQSCCSNDIDIFNSFVDNKYDVIIVGSDEVWKVNGYRGFPTPYFLPGDLHCKKVSYAASGRTSFSNLGDADQNLLDKYLNDFDYIGVRDYATYHEVASVVGRNKLHINYDPSFIYNFKPDAENGKKLLKKYFHVSGRKKVIGIMVNEGIRTKPNLGQYLFQNYRHEFEFVSLYDWNAFYKTYPKITPFEWIDLIAAVDGVISMYFHGICFSIICGTPFLAIEKRAKNNDESKLYDLLNRFNLTDNYVFGIENVFKEKRLDDFLTEVRDGTRYNFQNFVINARQEFSEFVEMLRNLQ